MQWTPDLVLQPVVVVSSGSSWSPMKAMYCPEISEFQFFK